MWVLEDLKGNFSNNQYNGQSINNIIIIITIIISSSSIHPLGQFGQEPEPSQATDMALVRAPWASS